VRARRAIGVSVSACAASAALALAGCQSTSAFSTSDSAASPQSSAYGATLIGSNGSVVGGIVRFVPRDDGIGVAVYATALPPGTFRVVIHARGNCSSPNAFSAGSPWSPAGVPPMVLTIAANPEGHATLSTRVRGYRLDGADGVIGKAVVLHEANGSLEAQPDVPNGRIACGVIGPMRTLSF
jgi:Cu-Zn family superoxide dismutase